MQRTQKPLTAIFLVVALVTNAYSAESDRTTSLLNQLSLPQLERKLVEIDGRLSSLAPNSLRSGIGVIGYRSDWRGTSDRQEWVEIKLDRAYPIDEIILVPPRCHFPNMPVA